MKKFPRSQRLILAAVLLLIVLVVLAARSGGEGTSAQVESQTVEEVTEEPAEDAADPQEAEAEEEAEEEAEAETEAADEQTADTEDTSTDQTTTQTTTPNVAVVTQSGELQPSLYQATFFNPDTDYSLIENLAALDLYNDTGKYLVYAAITITTDAGTVLHFEVYDLPNYGRAQLFDLNDATIDQGESIASIAYSGTSYLEGDQLMSDALEISTSGNVITLTNLTESTLSGLTLVYHSAMGADTFGGASQTMSLPAISAGSSVTVTATNCYFDEALAVRIY